MNNVTDNSRRRLLQMFGAAPLLPLSGLSATAFLAGCGGGSNSDTPVVVIPPSAITLGNVTFSNMAAPTLATAAAMSTMTVTGTMTATYSDTSTLNFKLAYQPFFVTGDMVPNGSGGTILAGGYVNINNQPIVDNTVPAKARQYFSDSPDGTSLLTVPNAKVTGVDADTRIFASGLIRLA